MVRYGPESVYGPSPDRFTHGMASPATIGCLPVVRLVRSGAAGQHLLKVFLGPAMMVTPTRSLRVYLALISSR